MVATGRPQNAVVLLVHKQEEEDAGRWVSQGEASFYGDTLRRFINLALSTFVHGQRSHQEYIPASKLRGVVVGVLLGKTGDTAVSLLLRCGQFGGDFCLHLWTEWQFVKC